MENLLHRRRAGHCQQPDERQQRDQRKDGTARGPRIGGSRRRFATGCLQVHFQNHRCGETERDAREELVRDAEDRPERFHAAIGIAHAGDEKESPGAHDEQAREDVGRSVLRVAERLPQMAKRILQQITAHARAGVERRQNEQRLEHDREVIPEIEPATGSDLGEDLRHANRERRRAAGTAEERVLANLLRQIIHLRNGKIEARGLHLRHRGGGVAGHVHTEIDARIQGARGDDRHDRHKRF